MNQPPEKNECKGCKGCDGSKCGLLQLRKLKKQEVPKKEGKRPNLVQIGLERIADLPRKVGE